MGSQDPMLTFAVYPPSSSMAAPHFLANRSSSLTILLLPFCLQLKGLTRSAPCQFPFSWDRHSGQQHPSPGTRPQQQNEGEAPVLSLERSSFSWMDLPSSKASWTLLSQAQRYSLCDSLIQRHPFPFSTKGGPFPSVSTEERKGKRAERITPALSLNY